LVGDVVPLTKGIFLVELYKNSLEYKKKVYEGEIIRQLMQTLPDNIDEYERHKMAYVMLHSDKN
jgi:hypothetical protein